jgi:hypothetical protein
MASIQLNFTLRTSSNCKTVHLLGSWDGYHVSHDPAKDHTTEPTTGRKLNIIDIPAAKSSSKSSSGNSKSRRVSTASIPKGRSLSPERIVAPMPQRPGQTRQVINTQYDKTTLEELNRRFAQQTVEDDSTDSEYDSDEGSDVPSLTSRSTNSSSPSSVSSGSSCCTCERFGITRSGDRVKLDCGGARCGYSDDSSDCSSEDEFVYEEKTTRRQGVVIRA